MAVPSTPPKACVTSRDVGADDATLLVGMRSERYDDGPTGDAMAGLDAVPRGPNMRRVGVHAVVDDDAAGLTHADARRPRQIRVGAHTETDHHEVGRHRTRRGFHGNDVPSGRSETGNRRAEPQVDTGGTQGVRDVASHVGVQDGTHRCVEQFDHRDVEAACKQTLRDFESDIARADHHGAPGAARQNRPLPRWLSESHGRDAQPLLKHFRPVESPEFS